MLQKNVIWAVLLFSAGARAGSFGFQDIITGDPTFSQALGINKSGVIAGYFGSGAVNVTPPPYTLTPNQGYTVSGPAYNSFTSQNFPGSSQTQVTGINTAGNTVGFYADSNGPTTPNFFGYVDVGGTFTSVIDPATSSSGPTSNQLLGLNDVNQAVGFYVDGAGNMQAYVYNLSSLAFTAVNPAGAVQAAATDINNSGLISGFLVLGSGDTEGFLDNGGSFTYFEVPGSTDTQFLGVNNSGQAVGFYLDAADNSHGLIYNISGGSYQSVDDPNGMGQPRSTASTTTARSSDFTSTAAATRLDC